MLVSAPVSRVRLSECCLKKGVERRDCFLFIEGLSEASFGQEGAVVGDRDSNLGSGGRRGRPAFMVGKTCLDACTQAGGKMGGS